MALRFSTGVTNNVAFGMGWGDIIKGSKIIVYSGTQPTSANDTATGTALCTFTTDGSAHTAETRAACKMVIAGSSGSIDSIAVGGVALLASAVSYTTSDTATAQAVVNAINSSHTEPDFYAVMGGTTVGSITYGTANAGEFYVLAPKNTGADFNNVTVTTASTTLTIALNTDATPSTAESGAFAAASGDSVSGYVAGVAASNGLAMAYPPALGVLTKSGTWKCLGANVTTGTAGWFRILCTPNYDTGLTNLATTGDVARLVMRIDGSIGTSSADMLVSTTSLTNGADQTVNSFSITVPSS